MKACVLLSVGLLLVVLGLPSQAAIYKWVDANGVVTYKDTPPPKGVTGEQFQTDPSFIVSSDTGKPPSKQASPTIPAKTLQGSKPVTPAKTVSKRIRPASFPPVEIYTTSWCPACKRAKRYLRSIKVPFKEYDVEKNRSAARRHAQLSPRGGVPVAVIGGSTILGFNKRAFNRALGIR